ncbi:TetR family transcriptional regulator [Chitinophaga skermanii]|uniref:TetR family transcriptional regulator n=1 Tax=Chitinophaga skermanii TaxID=331697 RepID=A0A327QW70_9BACT|nr:TetR/AcrR family transcriptional regulator [Chitinophaga skermanii]RAJ08916.1 TetR family transcriptional regulator [Chitinophaga skermanii]
MKEEVSTEELIINAARKVFTTRGYNGARMQEIADEAGINKAMLHYYYRSKDKLFDIIFDEAVDKLMLRINTVFEAQGSITDKIAVIVDMYITTLSDNPYLPLFVLHEMSQHSDRIVKRFMAKPNFPNIQLFLDEVNKEIKQKKIAKIEPEQLLINVLAMCVFPFVAKPLIQGVLRKDDVAYKVLLEERKRSVVKFINAALAI